MKQFFLSAATVFLTITCLGQQQDVQTRKLVYKTSLQMARTSDDEMPGRRGASVAWHPIQKKYYASMAGNSGYPIGVFDASGKRLSHDSCNTLADTRGLWYNGKTKSIEGSTYPSQTGISGIFRYTLDANGMVKSIARISSFAERPADNSCGVYQQNGHALLFLADAKVHRFDAGSYLATSTHKVRWGRTKLQGADSTAVGEFAMTDHNATNMVCLNEPGAEWAFLNFTTLEIECYNQADGFLTRKYKIPAEAKAEPSFNFAYANGLFWFFDMDKRVWQGFADESRSK